MENYYYEISKRENAKGELLKYIYFKLPTICEKILNKDCDVFFEVDLNKKKMVLKRSLETEERICKNSFVARVRIINDAYYVPVPYDFFDEAYTLESSVFCYVTVVNECNLEVTEVSMKEFYDHMIAKMRDTSYRLNQTAEPPKTEKPKKETKKATKKKMKLTKEVKENIVKSYRRETEYWEDKCDIKNFISRSCSISYDEAGYALFEI